MNARSFHRKEEPQLSYRKTIIAAALAAVALPAVAQQDAPNDAKAFVDATCNTCHPLQARVGTGNTEEGWYTVLRMMTNHGVGVPPEKQPALVAYLEKTYPVRGRPDAKVLPGPTKVTMRSWGVPTPGSRPHEIGRASGRARVEI